MVRKMRVVLLLAILLTVSLAFRVPLKRVKHTYPNAGKIVPAPKFKTVHNLGAAPLDPYVCLLSTLLKLEI